MSERTLYFLWPVLFLMLCFYKAPAQNILVKHYGVNEGMPSSECYWVMQDSRHFLWIATDAGIVKYDGYKFITYNSSKGLPDNTVFKVHEDRHGRIWFSSYSGAMAYYSYETDSIYSIPANKKLNEIIKLLPVDFCFDARDTLWIALQQYGYIKVVPPLYKQYWHYLPKTDAFYIKEVSPENFIYGIGRIGDSVAPYIPLKYLPFGRAGNGFVSDAIIQPRISLLSAIKTAPGSYLFSNGVSVFGVKGQAVSELINYRTKYNDEDVINLFKDSKNNLWLGTSKHGALLYENADPKTAPKKIIAPGNIVSCVFEDADNGYWFSTTNNGLNYIPSLKYNYFNSSSGLSADKVYAISIINNNLYAAVNDHQLNILNLATKQFTYYNTERVAYIFGAGQALFFTNATASCLLNLNNNKTITLKNNAGQNIYLKKITEFNGQQVLAFDHSFNIWKINTTSGKADFVTKFSKRIHCLYAIGNTIFIGTKQGLYKMESGKISFLGDELPLLTNRVAAMTFYDSTLFIATRGYGVLCFKNNKIVKQFNQANGLASDICNHITKDENDNIWVGTNRGISRIKYKKGIYSCNTLNVSNGLVSNEISQVIAFKDQLYFATNNGIGNFNIADAFDKNTAIPVYIEDFFVNNIKEKLNAKQLLNYDQNFIKINYKGIYLKNEGNIDYKYRLEGLDTAWTYTKNTFVQFTTLPAGAYRFVIYAINANDTLSTKPAVIEFTIKKPFWKTWWFIFLIIGLMLLLLYAAYRSRIAGIKQKQEEKAEFAKQLIESELKGLRSQMNPHFIFNAINSIQNFVIKNESVTAQKYLTKFSRLIRSVLENSKHETILLEKEIETLKLYLELEALRASFSFDYEVRLDQKLKGKTIYIPTMLIQPYVENAILHGVLPLKDLRGNVCISFEEENDLLICKIDDNGIGRKKAQEIKQKKNLNHQSMAMSLTRQRIDNINKNNHLFIDVIFIDKMENEQAAGTTVVLKIKTANL